MSLRQRHPVGRLSGVEVVEVRDGRSTWHSHNRLHGRRSARNNTRLVAELEVKKLVLRTADPADGRASLIQVTDAGLGAVQ